MDIEQDHYQIPTDNIAQQGFCKTRDQDTWTEKEPAVEDIDLRWD